VEVTGGEPLLQPNTILLLEKLLESGYEVLLETNGSLPLDAIPDQVIKIVDVKCPDSGCGNSFLLSNLDCMSAHDELKFVLASREDYDFALEFISTRDLGDRIILFSPVSAALEAPKLAEWMLRDGVSARLQVQLHRVLGLP
jgi:7-carboxy-7-deazaguanine synthase